MRAYHFVGDRLRNGQPVPPDGEWLEYAGPLPIILCERGLHASVHPFDALKYAPGSILCRVELAGEILADTDKHVATRRKIIFRKDVETVCRTFARRCALDVVPRWDAPEVVKEFLETGDESKRAAALDASWAASRDVAAATAAAWAAALDAASAAAWDVAAAAAAASAAARDVVVAERHSAGAAALDAALDAASAAAWDVAAAAAAAWAAARDVELEKYRQWFAEMVDHEFGGPW